MNKPLGFLLTAALGWAAVAVPSASAQAPARKVVLIAGRPSHGPGDHEFNAGVTLLARCLREAGAEPVIVRGGWPQDENVFNDAASVVFFMDGGSGHPMIQKDRLDRVMKPLTDKGVGLACMHYAVEVPRGKPGDDFLDWIGGYYETGFSTNPHWTAHVESLPDHPITRGVKPFAVRDEWYFNIRFRPDMKGVTPILVAKPDDQTRQGVSSSPRGPYRHIVEAKGRDEVLAWAVERPDGGRGFGFTGAHAHKNWGDPNFRKLVLNAILWTARADVPAQGVSCDVSPSDLTEGLDPKGRR
jgi:type 1 glutamine amidotransferase